ncbi:alpha/beta hydrolase [Telmatospirillum sp. J64-1]|uniref:alpha/beta hydrolase n=1 Tax=Telmatospirillum sp. J64-1 TaxID=2502183 RepID=UPI00115C9B21|nr:alpha/beta hydrolase [Telmatospirillum sp. J64-1]
MSNDRPLPILDRDYAAALARLRQQGIRPARPEDMPLDLARLTNQRFYAAVNGPVVQGCTSRDETVSTPGVTLRLRLYRPDHLRKPCPVIVYFHGGGFVMNDLETHDRLCRTLAIYAGATLCAVEYSLAPETPFPGQLIEAELAISWLLSQADELGLHPGKLVLAGDSAGANIALSTALKMRDQPGPMPAGLLLFYGMYWAEFETASHKLFGDGACGLTTKRMEWFWDQFLPDAHDRFNPLAAPLIADLRKLPPCFLLAAEFDCLRDDTVLLEKRLRAAGVEVKLSVYSALPHSFLQFSRLVPRARQGLREAAEAMQDMIGGIS